MFAFMKRWLNFVLTIFGPRHFEGNVRDPLVAAVGWKSQLYWDILQTMATEAGSQHSGRWRHPTAGTRPAHWEKPLVKYWDPNWKAQLKTLHLGYVDKLQFIEQTIIREGFGADKVRAMFGIQDQKLLQKRDNPVRTPTASFFSGTKGRVLHKYWTSHQSLRWTLSKLLWLRSILVQLSFSGTMKLSSINSTWGNASTSWKVALLRSQRKLIGYGNMAVSQCGLPRKLSFVTYLGRKTKPLTTWSIEVWILSIPTLCSLNLLIKTSSTIC